MAHGGGRSPFQIRLRASERRCLKARARRQAAPFREVVRARIVLDAAAGLSNALIARRVGVVPNTVGKWRKRFVEEGFAGLRDRPRPGRPRVYPAAVVAHTKAIACELPAIKGVPLARWSLSELRCELLACGLVDDVSISTLWRWLDADALKPWQYRSWIWPRDPDFAAKAGVVLDLYERRFAGRKLEAYEFVISADEKTQIQARCRCDPTTGIGPFGRLVEQVMTVEPYASAKRVYWMVDNGSSHRGRASVQRLE